MKRIYLILLVSFLNFNLLAQEEKVTLVLPQVSLTQKKSDLFIPSVFIKGKASKESIAKVLVDSLGVLKAGLVDGTGKFILKPLYKEFGKTDSGIIPLIKENGKVDFFSIALKQLIPENSDEYKILSSNLILVSENFRWGAVHIENDIVKKIPNVYKSIQFDSASQSLKLLNYNKWKIQSIEKDSIGLKAYSYDSLVFIDKEHFIFFVNRQIGQGSCSKGELIPAGAFLFQPHKETVCFKTYLNDSITPEYASLFINGIYRVDSIGQIIYPFKSSQYSDYKKVSKGLVKVKHNNKYGIIDTTGKVLIPVIYDSLRGPFVGDKIFIVYNGKLVAIFDGKGSVLSEPQERTGKIFDFREGRAMFSKAGYLGFMDVRGNTRVAPQYKEARDFSEGLAAVLLKGKWCFIDKDENIIAQPLYDEVKDYVNGLAAVRKDKHWFFINRRGERTTVSFYDSVALSDNGKWMVFRAGKTGLVSVEGKELLAPRYNFIQDVGADRVIVEKAGKWGVIDYAENFIISLKYDKIKYSKVLDKFLLMEKGKEETFSLIVELRKK